MSRLRHAGFVPPAALPKSVPVIPEPAKKPWRLIFWEARKGGGGTGWTDAPRLRLVSPYNETMDFRVMSGSLDLYRTAIMAIRNDYRVKKLPEGFETSVPKRFRGKDNTGSNRQILLLKRPDKPQLVLRLAGSNTISRDFELWLKNRLQRRKVVPYEVAA